jgi:hypothetical protein
MSTKIIQSHRIPLPYDWLDTCMNSVRYWCDENKYEYQFLDDAFFDFLPERIRNKYDGRQVVLADLARLKAIQAILDQGYDRVVWLDADMLVFRPELFLLPAADNLPEGYMLGREVWVQSRPDKPNKLQAHKKVHNAFLLFDRHNSFLDFYADQAERMLSLAKQSIPPQFIGPKLLTALHNIIGCPVMEAAGMLSPAVIEDLLSQGQKTCALNLMLKRSSVPLVAANLCGSSVTSGAISNKQMNSLCMILLQQSVCL